METYVPNKHIEQDCENKMQSSIKPIKQSEFNSVNKKHMSDYEKLDV